MLMCADEGLVGLTGVGRLSCALHECRHVLDWVCHTSYIVKEHHTPFDLQNGSGSQREDGWLSKFER